MLFYFVHINAKIDNSWFIRYQNSFTHQKPVYFLFHFHSSTIIFTPQNCDSRCHSVRFDLIISITCLVFSLDPVSKLNHVTSLHFLLCCLT